MDPKAVAELAPTGVLRAGINMSNFLLVNGKTPSGDPTGVSPSMAAEIAKRLGVPVTYVPFKNPGELADAAGKNQWDIGLIADEPARAKVMAFSGPYVEIEATYLVPAGSTIKNVSEVDRAGVTIVVPARSAYELWLSRNIKNAELLLCEPGPAAMEKFKAGGVVLAGLKPGLIEDVKKVAGARMLDGRFTAVQQAIGTNTGRPAALQFIKDFVEEAKKTGFVAKLIEHHKVVGLSVAQ